MSKKSFIDTVEVKTPCSEDWDKMTGSDKVRFCSHCSKNVSDLSAITRKQAVRLVRESSGDLCIRYIKNPVTQRPIFADQLYQITRRVPRLAAGVMTASISLSTMSYAQGGASTQAAKPQPAVERTLPTESERAGTPLEISGTVADPNGAVLINAKVTLTGIDAKGTQTALSDSTGSFVFKDLDRGNYLIEADAVGFKKTSSEITLVDKNASVDLALAIGEVTYTIEVPADRQIYAIAGDVAFVEYRTPLARAVADNHLELARDLISRGENVNGKDKNYDDITPLFLAVENGSLEMVRMLLDFGAKVNARDKTKQTPIMQLDEEAGVELVQMLIRAGAKLDLVDTEGDTPLITAARLVKPEVLRVLIDAGARVNVANKEGETPLMAAAETDDIEKVRMLILAGADVNAKDKEGETAIERTSDSDIEDLLVTYGAIIEDDDEGEVVAIPRSGY